MEGSSLACGVIFAMGFASVFALVLALCLRVKRIRRERLSFGVMGDGETLHARLIRNGFGTFMPAAAFLLRFEAVQAYASHLLRALGAKGYDSCAAQLVSLLLALVALCLTVGSVVAASLVFGVALAGCLVVMLGCWAKHSLERAADEFKEAIPDALRTMQTCFSVGHSLRQTFDQVAQRSDGPLSVLFGKAAGVLASGGTVHDSLDCLKKGADDPELLFLSTALEIQHRTGSSIQQVLEVTRGVVEGDLEMRRSLRTQTAQARLSARIVTVMPFALVALFSLLSEGFLSPFFESFVGICLLSCALLMQLGGVLLVRKMLKVGVM